MRFYDFVALYLTARDHALIKPYHSTPTSGDHIIIIHASWRTDDLLAVVAASEAATTDGEWLSRRVDTEKDLNDRYSQCPIA